MLVTLAVLTACSGSSPRLNADASGSVGSSVPVSVSTTEVVTEAPTASTAPATTAPVTTAATTTTTELLRPDLFRSVAFLDTCIDDASTAGACRCGLSEISRAIADDQWEEFEDRIVAEQDLPPAIVDALAGCRGAEVPSIGDLQRVRLEAACAGVVGRTDSACQCAVDRASIIVPVDLVEDYAATVDGEIEPSMADLVARCL